MCVERCLCCCGMDGPQLDLFFLRNFNPFSHLLGQAPPPPSSPSSPVASMEAAAAAGTITVPIPLPSPEEDAQKLREAFQGWGTDEKTVVDILAHRTAAQRAAIAAVYAGLFDEPLIRRLHSELSGDFRKAVMLWTTDPAERDAKLANDALNMNDERNLWILIEVSCASSPDHLMAVRKAYCSLFSSSIEEDVAYHFANQESIRQLLVRLITSYRYDGEHVDEDMAKHEAKELYDATKNKELHKDNAIRILSMRNKRQLKETFNLYKQDYGKDIEEDIEENDKSQLALMLKAMIWCIAFPEKHFAEVIRASVVGLGTDEDSLTRAVVNRAEIDMKKIKEEYMNRYNTTVNADVIGDTSGDYRNFLLSLIGYVDT